MNTKAKVQADRDTRAEHEREQREANSHQYRLWKWKHERYTAQGRKKDAAKAYARVVYWEQQLKEQEEK